MKVFRDLIVSGDAATLLAAVDWVERMLSSGWERSSEAEGRLKALAVG